MQHTKGLEPSFMPPIFTGAAACSQHLCAPSLYRRDRHAGSCVQSDLQSSKLAWFVNGEFAIDSSLLPPESAQ